jgi:hypothetical protein
MAGSFRIQVEFAGGLTAEQRKIFQDAARRWERVIRGPSQILRIRASGISIDGAGKVLGQAGPTALHSTTGLPVAGIMEFDVSDLAFMQRAGTLASVILHEMGHVLGIGTLWKDRNLLRGSGTNNPEYTGIYAMHEYAKLRDNVKTPRPIPVENTGGPGTAEGHWSEATFDHELMTGYAEDTANMPLSRMTVASLQDLGYVVDYAAADEYVMPYRPPTADGRMGGLAFTRKSKQRYCHARFPKLPSRPSTTVPLQSNQRSRILSILCAIVVVVALLVLAMALWLLWGNGCNNSIAQDILEALQVIDYLC